MTSAPPLVIVNAVGLTSRLLRFAPYLQALAKRGWQRELVEPIPAVTCTAQACVLTGVAPEGHGIVGNGWHFRETGEVRFWQQANQLLQAEPLYVSARRLARERGQQFRCAKLFWWFNQGADVDISVTPKPYYGADGNKVFGITGRPAGLTDRLEKKLGSFPFHTFWGPRSGRACNTWIARCAGEVIESNCPELTFVYLPFLDYDPQRFGPSGSDMAGLVKHLDEDIALILDSAAVAGARVWVLSEYGHVDVRRPVHLNRILREQGLISVRPGPFGEVLDTFESAAFAVCDHQLAHVYVRNQDDLPRVQDALGGIPGIGQVFAGPARHEIGLDHPRAGDLVLLSEPDAWFAYPYWLEDRHAPDFARTVDIHRKPGYDPCELLFDPKLLWPTGRVIRRLLQKKLGFRTLFDIVPLDASLIRGSHGLRASEGLDRPVLVGEGPAPPEGCLAMTAVHDLILRAVAGD